MPFQIGGVATHDDGQHIGSAKRGTASGVKGIDAGLNLDPKLVNADVDAAAAIAKTKLASLDIVNADVNAAAAIAKTKLASLDIVNADVNAAAAIAKTKLASLDIVNADVNAAAAIAISKLESGVAKIAVVPAYNGDNTTNRAIAHGLGIVPKLALVVIDAGNITGIQNSATKQASREDTGIYSVQTVTAWDATNIYVSGNLWNLTGATNYRIIVIG
jgi:hypothetical protein